MLNTINIQWKNDMYFETEVNGHPLKLDADEAFGGQNKGPRPKPLLLVALGGCTSMDVVSLLKKMRINIKDISVSVSGTMTEEHPKYYKAIKIIYKVSGENIPYSKLKRAVELSQDKYCGVNAMLKKANQITYEIIGDGIDFDK